MVPVRAHGPGRATRVRRMATRSGRIVPRVGGSRRLGIAVTRAGETMMRTVAVFGGCAVRGAAHRHYRPAAGSGRRGLRRPEYARWGDSGSDGAAKSALTRSSGKGANEDFSGAALVLALS